MLCQPSTPPATSRLLLPNTSRAMAFMFPTLFWLVMPVVPALPFMLVGFHWSDQVLCPPSRGCFVFAQSWKLTAPSFAHSCGDMPQHDKSLREIYIYILFKFKGWLKPSKNNCLILRYKSMSIIFVYYLYIYSSPSCCSRTWGVHSPLTINSLLDIFGMNEVDWTLPLQ